MAHRTDTRKARSARRRGQGLPEYGLILALIAVVAMAALNATGGSVQGLMEHCLTAASTTGPINGCSGLSCPSGRGCLASAPGAACCWGSTSPHCHTPCP